MEITNELNGGGFVKIYRSTLQKGWYQRSEYVHLWVHLIMLAQFAESETWFNGETIKLKPGQLVTGRKKLSMDTGIPETTVERILNCFESGQQIGQQKSNKSRLISILNWSKWQESGQQNGQQTDNKRTTNGQQADTIIRMNKNIKNDKKESSEPASPSSPPAKLLDKQKAMKDRQHEFGRSLIPFTETYGKKMIREFYDYWSEPNKSGTKFKMEMEKTWDIEKRLARWEERQHQFSKGSPQAPEQTNNPIVDKIKAAVNGLD
jgi:hypothetical protein